MLQFNGVATTFITIGASATQVQNALNDIPNLSPNLINVTESLKEDQVSKVYTVQFSIDLGDVPNIEEISGNVAATIEEKTKGISNGTKIQLTIQNATTNLFDMNDTATNVNLSNLNVNY